MSFIVDGKKLDSVNDFIAYMDSQITWYEKWFFHPYFKWISEPIKNFYYGLIHLPKNIKKWGKFVWYDRDWDYSFTLEAFEIKCRAQGNNLSKYGNAVDSKERAEQCFKCSDALKRMREDNYTSDIDELVYDNKIEYKVWSETHEERLNKDKEIIKQSIDIIQGWWD